MTDLAVMTVDDEPLARRRLALALAEVPGFDLVAEADGCEAGLQQFERSRPDIVIVDIKMRDGTGFDFVERLRADRPTALIFATAFDHFAVRAFDTPAVDYVLKPIEVDRLRAALHRARTRLAESAASADVAELSTVIANLRQGLSDQASMSAASPGREVWVRGRQGAMTRVALADIQSVTSEDDYIRLHVAGRSYLVRMSIRAFAEHVPPGDFIRVRRSALVRRSAIVDVVRSGGQVHAVLADGSRIEAGRVHARGLFDMVRTARLG